MVRVKRGKIVRKKHKKILKQVKGMRGVRKASVKRARETVMKALSYAYRDRRTKKRELRKSWIVTLNNALREKGITYSSFINGLKNKKIKINRKILADLAVNNPDVFDKLVLEVKK